MAKRNKIWAASPTIEIIQKDQESILDDSITNVINKDVFTESLKSEDCATSLYSCMKKLEEEMKKLLQICEKTKDSQIKGKSQLNSLSEAMDFMTNKFEEYEQEQLEKDKIKIKVIWLTRTRRLTNWRG